MEKILKHPEKKPKIKRDLNVISSKVFHLMTEVPNQNQFKFVKDMKLAEEIYTYMFRIRFNIRKLLDRME